MQVFNNYYKVIIKVRRWSHFNFIYTSLNIYIYIELLDCGLRKKWLEKGRVVHTWILEKMKSEGEAKAECGDRARLVVVVGVRNLY